MTAARKLPEPTMLALDKIRLDGGTQSRAKLSEDSIAEYAECIAELPAIDVFFDGESYWLADGFHRHAAFVRAGRKNIRCVLHDGDVHDARRFAAGCNRAHGNRRNREDVRASILLLVRDEKWKDKSDNWVAKEIGCSPPTVFSVRTEFKILKSAVRETSTGHKVDTSKIGRPKKPKPEPSASPKSEPRATPAVEQWACPRCGTGYPKGTYPETAKLCAACAKTDEKPKARPAPEKWECEECHSWWPADVAECRDCASADESQEPDAFDATQALDAVDQAFESMMLAWPREEPLAPVVRWLRTKLGMTEEEAKQWPTK